MNESADHERLLERTVFIRGVYRPFGELTPEDASARADELRAVIGWGPTCALPRSRWPGASSPWRWSAPARRASASSIRAARPARAAHVGADVRRPDHALSRGATVARRNRRVFALRSFGQQTALAAQTHPKPPETARISIRGARSNNGHAHWDRGDFGPVPKSALSGKSRFDSWRGHGNVVQIGVF